MVALSPEREADCGSGLGRTPQSLRNVPLPLQRGVGGRERIPRGLLLFNENISRKDVQLKDDQTFIRVDGHSDQMRAVRMFFR